jgi:hypothetical protein
MLKEWIRCMNGKNSRKEESGERAKETLVGRIHVADLKK